VTADLNTNDLGCNHLPDELFDVGEIEIVTGVPRLAHSAIGAAQVAIRRCRQQNRVYVVCQQIIVREASWRGCGIRSRCERRGIAAFAPGSNRFDGCHQYAP
jgi:hypothetical protein